MAIQLSNDAETLLSAKTIQTYYKIEINGVDRTSDVLSYGYSFNRQFGAAQASIVLNNNSGAYSPGGATEVVYNHTVEITEGLYVSGSPESWPKFYGIVRQKPVSNNQGDNSIQITALDLIVRMEDLEISQTFETADKNLSGTSQNRWEELTPNSINGYSDMADVWTAVNSDIAHDPVPLLRLSNETTGQEDPKLDKFEIDYETGQVITNPINKNDHKLKMKYSYYGTGLFVEDILEDIIIAEDGYCYSDDTEVLTEDGWILLKKIVDKKLKIKVATLNPGKNIVEYCYPTEYISNSYKGKMFLQEGKRINFKVTPNHKVWCRSINRTIGNKKYFKFVEARDVNKTSEYLKEFPYEGEEREYFVLPKYINKFKVSERNNKWGGVSKSYDTEIAIDSKKIKMNDWLRFFGIWLAEGWVSKAKNGTYNIVKISQYKKNVCEIIKTIFEDLGFKYRYCNKKKDFIRIDALLGSYLKKFGKSYDKYIPKEIKSLSKRQLNILFESMMLGDGTVRKDGLKIYTTASKKLADDVQEIGLKIGFSPNIYKENDNLYRVIMSKKSFSHPNSIDKRKWIDYDGYTYCLNVPNHLLYTRREGKGCWNGNSNTPFSTATNLTTNYTAEDGGSTDTLIPNYIAQTIDGVEYAAGRVWYMTYSNVTTNLVSGDYTVPGATISLLSQRYGRIILNTAISTGATVTYNQNYNFKTLQASGIEVSKVAFNYKNTRSRLDAINQIRSLCAPNYIIRTKGTNKFWASYLNQKYTEDYTLKLNTALTFTDDQDLYTRVKQFGKNSNPTDLTIRGASLSADQTLYQGYAHNQVLGYYHGPDENANILYNITQLGQTTRYTDFTDWTLGGSMTRATTDYKTGPNCLYLTGASGGYSYSPELAKPTGATLAVLSGLVKWSHVPTRVVATRVSVDPYGSLEKGYCGIRIKEYDSNHTLIRTTFQKLPGEDISNWQRLEHRFDLHSSTEYIRAEFAVRKGLPGYSQSDANAALDLSYLGAAKLAVNIDGAGATDISLTPANMTSSFKIAEEIQTKLRAVGSGGYLEATCQFNGADLSSVVSIRATIYDGIGNVNSYTIKSGTTGASSSVVVTEPASDSVTTLLKLGVPKGGIEQLGEAGFTTITSYCDNVQVIFGKDADTTQPHEDDGNKVFFDTGLDEFAPPDRPHRLPFPYYAHTPIVISDPNDSDYRFRVYINGLEITDTPHQIIQNPVRVLEQVITTTTSGNITKSAKVETEYSYTLKFPHSAIMQEEAIYIYDENGVQLSFSPLGPLDVDVDYTNGTWSIPSYISREDVMKISTASYWIQYSRNRFGVEGAKIWVGKELLSKDRNDLVSASFKYWDIMALEGDMYNIIDGSWDTQTQVVFYTQPANGLHFMKVDLGSIQDVDTIDLTAGWFEPKAHNDDPRRYSVTNYFSLEYSTDNSNWYPLSKSATYFKMGSGETTSFESDELGEDFQMRYLRLTIEDSEMLPYGNGIWCVSLVKLGIFQDMVLKSEATLVAAGPETDTTLIDTDSLLPILGDRLYKDATINRFLTTQTKIDKRTKDLLTEFYKNHTGVIANVEFAGHLELGQTVRVIDNVNSVDEDFFIESINNSNGMASLNLARYPGLYG